MPDGLTLITGASSDIGVALMRHLLVNTRRTIVAHSFRGNARIAELQQEFGERVISIEADLGDLQAVRAFVEQVAGLGSISAVVHLPALRPVNERFTKFDWAHFERDFTIQLRSVAMLLQRLLPKMAKNADTRVVFMLSSYVHNMPPKFTAMYTIAKYAQLGLMRSLAAEYASTQVRINAISPSMVETQFLGAIPELAVQMTAAANPLARNATPADLIGVFDLLLSPASAYMMGVDVPVAAGTVV